MRHPGEATDSDRPAGMKRYLWLIVLAAIALIWYTAQAISCASFIPTGDALYDRYARAVIQRQAWQLFSGGQYAAVLPDSVLEGWQSEFGDDPRYWQLRYWCRLHQHDIINSKLGWRRNANDKEMAPIFLNQAVSNGVADAETLLLLYEISREKWDDEIDQAEDYPDALAEVARRIEDEQLTALNEIVAADPDFAWSYYQRAFYWFSRGDLARGDADLRAGNAAPVCRMPRTFPVSLVLDKLANELPAGNPYLEGAILRTDEHYTWTHWSKWRKHGEAVLAAADAGGDLGTLTAMHRFACRMAILDRASWLEQRDAAEFASLLAYGALTGLSDDMTGDQRMALLHVALLENRIHRSTGSWSMMNRERWVGKRLMNEKRWPPKGNRKTELDQPRHILHKAAGVCQFYELHLPWRFYLEERREWVSVRDFEKRVNYPKITEVAEVDYSVLDYNPDWKPIT